jgi:hypothetical protein
MNNMRIRKETWSSMGIPNIVKSLREYFTFFTFINSVGRNIIRYFFGQTRYFKGFPGLKTPLFTVSCGIEHEIF